MEITTFRDAKIYTKRKIGSKTKTKWQISVNIILSKTSV